MFLVFKAYFTYYLLNIKEQARNVWVLIKSEGYLCVYFILFFLYLAPLKRSFMEVDGLELLLFFWETEKMVICMVHARHDCVLSVSMPQGEPAPWSNERGRTWDGGGGDQWY